VAPLRPVALAFKSLATISAHCLCNIDCNLAYCVLHLGVGRWLGGAFGGRRLLVRHGEAPWLGTAFGNLPKMPAFFFDFAIHSIARRSQRIR
jgi:hypothetical protein